MNARPLATIAVPREHAEELADMVDVEINTEALYTAAEAAIIIGVRGSEKGRRNAMYNIPRIKDCRGVFATYFLRAGGDPRELQRILGHARIETTLRYIKRLPIEEADKMAETEKRQGLALLGIERAG